jgi:transcriptional regulator with XRE-family HTH domain
MGGEAGSRLTDSINRPPRAGDAQSLFDNVRRTASRHKARDIAKLIGVSESRISQLLRSANPTIKTLDEILAAVSILDRRAGGHRSKPAGEVKKDTMV